MTDILKLVGDLSVKKSEDTSSIPDSGTRTSITDITVEQTSSVSYYYFVCLFMNMDLSSQV